MKSWLTHLFSLSATVLLLSACNKDEDRITVQTSEAPVLTASAVTNPVLTKAEADNVAVTYTWTPFTLDWSGAAGAYDVPVTYSLQFDKKGNDFAAAQEVTKTSVITAALTVKELNAIFTALQEPVGVPSTLDVRLVTTYVANRPTMYSATTNLTATPYESREAPKDTWALIGPAGVDWGTDIPMTYDFDTKTFTLTRDLKADEFKFRANGGWDLNYGDLPAADGKTLAADGANLKAPSAGNYTITLNLNSKPAPTYSLKKN